MAVRSSSSASFRKSSFESLRSEEHTSELQSHSDLVCRLLLEKKKKLKMRDAREAVAPFQRGTAGTAAGRSARVGEVMHSIAIALSQTIARHQVQVATGGTGKL